MKKKMIVLAIPVWLCGAFVLQTPVPFMSRVYAQQKLAPVSLLEQAQNKADGTQEAPFCITDGAQLVELWTLLDEQQTYTSSAGKEQAFGMAYYRMENTISLEQYPDWRPIASKPEEAFGGVFDGNGYAIQGLRLGQTEGASGLFGYVSGTVQNLTLTNVRMGSGIQENGNVEQLQYTGGIAANLRGASIINCVVTGELSGAVCGGIAGRMMTSEKENTTLISQCRVNGAISTKSGMAGGIVGSADAESHTVVSQSYFMGSVVSEGAQSTAWVGGIAGSFMAGDNSVIANCAANASISCAGGEGVAGGIAGEIGGEKTAVSHCVAQGTVSANKSAGGVVGTGSGFIVGCSALSASVNCANGAGRISDPAADLVITDSSASAVMWVNGAQSMGGLVNDANGESILAVGGKWDPSYTWNTFSKDIWNIHSGNTPTLKHFELF